MSQPNFLKELFTLLQSYIYLCNPLILLLSGSPMIFRLSNMDTLLFSSDLISQQHLVDILTPFLLRISFFSWLLRYLLLASLLSFWSLSLSIIFWLFHFLHEFLRAWFSSMAASLLFLHALPRCSHLSNGLIRAICGQLLYSHI